MANDDDGDGDGSSIAPVAAASLLTRRPNLERIGTKVFTRRCRRRRRRRRRRYEPGVSKLLTRRLTRSRELARV